VAAVCAAVVGVLGLLGAPAWSQAAPASARQQLADRFAPVVLLVDQGRDCDTTGEPYRPVPVEAVLGQPDVVLRDAAGRVLVTAPTAADLAGAAPNTHLDLPGRALRPGCTYEQWARRTAAGLPTTAYARVVVAPDHGLVLVQYWLYYVFNDWNNRHESDWEMLQVVFEAHSVEAALAGEPVAVGYSQHEGAERAAWDAATLARDGDHPVVRPAVGSHANHVTEDLFLGHSAQEGFGCDDTRGPATATLARAVLLPAEVPVNPGDPFAWLAFEGRWGERNRGPNNGPTGPATKDSWIDPVAWMQDEWRDASTVVPAASAFGSSGTDFFCRAVAAGSGVYLAVLDTPLAVLGALGALVLCALWLGRRTVWSPLVVLPVDTPRSSGQILRSAAALYRRLLPLMLGIGLLLIPVGAVAAVIQQVVFEWTPLGTLVATAASDRLFGVIVALLLGSLAAVFAIAVVQGTVAAALAAVERGERPGALAAYRAVLPQVPAILRGTVRTVALVSLLALTVVGVPLALRVGVRRALVPQAVVHEGLRTSDAVRRARTLVTGNAVRVGILAAVANIVVSVGAPLLATLVLLVLSPPLGVVNLLAGLLGVVFVPYAGIVLTLLFHDLRRRSAFADRPEDPGAGRSTARTRVREDA
jgi:hypothetical protein